jgi:hypothetical protein
VSTHWWRAAFAVVAVLAGTPLSAQTRERDDVHLRNDCRLAAQVISTGHPAPRREWAYGIIRGCDESGPRTLAMAWRTSVPGDPASLGLLVAATRTFNDRSVVDAVSDVARNRDAPEAARVHAFTLLYSYAVPGLYVDAGDLLDRPDAPPAIVAVSHDHHVHQTRASLGDLRPEVGRLLGEVVATEPATRVGCAAASVLRYLHAS